MALLQEAPSGAAESATTPTRTRRWPKRVLIGGLVLVAVAIAFVTWADHYQPIRWMGYTYEWPYQQVVEPGQIQNWYSYQVTQAGSTFVVYPRKPGDQFGFRYSLNNHGPFGVRILGLDVPEVGVKSLPNPKASGITAEPVTQKIWGPQYEGITPPPPGTLPLRPFSLASGALSRPVGMTWTIHGSKWAKCRTGQSVAPPSTSPGSYYGGYIQYPWFTVTYKFLWFTHTAFIPFDHPLTIATC